MIIGRSGNTALARRRKQDNKNYTPYVFVTLFFVIICFLLKHILLLLHIMTGLLRATLILQVYWWWYIIHTIILLSASGHETLARMPVAQLARDLGRGFESHRASAGSLAANQGVLPLWESAGLKVKTQDPKLLTMTGPATINSNNDGWQYKNIVVCTVN